MHWYHATLLIGVLGAGVLARNLPRAWLWLGLGALSFVVSSIWHNAALPYGAAFGGATNIAICFAIYAWGRQRWELRVLNCIHIMILLDVLYLAGFIKSHWQFAVAIEAANWLAIMVIGATGLLERAGDGIAARLPSRHLLGAVRRALFAPRKHLPFWEAH